MVDWSKSLETDCENPVPARVLTVDGYGPYHIAVWVDLWGAPLAFNFQGECHPDMHKALPGAEKIRLRNVRPKPVKREGWVNVYGGQCPRVGNLEIYMIEEDAMKNRGLDTNVSIATIRIEWEEVPNG